MQLITITGLATYEKAQLAHDLAHTLAARGQGVTIIDNSNRRELESTDRVDVTRIAGGCVCCSLPGKLYKTMATVQANTVILIASESAHPESLMAVMANLVAGQPEIEVKTIGVIDDRTCNCFPHLHEIMEDYADLTLRRPFNLDDALAIL